MHVLALNCGSSSLKFALYRTDLENPSGDEGDAPQLLARGIVDGMPGASTLRVEGTLATPPKVHVTSHADAAVEVLRWITSRYRLDASDTVVGHRVVHGGSRFRGPVLITSEVIEELDSVSSLAPLHNTAAVAVIRALEATQLGRAPQVASFDTAFHRSMPARAARYAIPDDLWPGQLIERFGFHGLAHQSMLEHVVEMNGRSRADLKLITVQLGSGCSAAAILGGTSVDTSMGFTPLEGLMMATRSGDVDPSLPVRVAAATGASPQEILDVLSSRSGLLGVSGLSPDIRVLLDAEAAGDVRAALAVEMFCYRVRKQIGAYLAALGGAHAIAFGGGIGQHLAEVRRRICTDLEWCGVRLDPVVNERASGDTRISARDSLIEVFVVDVDEESLIAREASQVAAPGARRQ